MPAITKHFPDHSLTPYGIETITADDFLIHQHHFDKNQVLTILEQQATKKGRSSRTLNEAIRERTQVLHFG